VNGILQNKPPINPNSPNCHMDSDPDAPKLTPRIGMKNVR